MKWIMGVALAVLLLAGGGQGAFAADQRYCPKGKTIRTELPGLPLVTDYLVARRREPAAKRCDHIDPVGECFFVDRFGQRNWVTPDLRPADRYIWQKEAFRTAGGPLPFAITWKDSPRQVSDKLRAGGFATRLHQTKDGEQVEILNEVCGSFGGDLWIEFHFKGGQLQKVVHMFNWL